MLTTVVEFIFNFFSCIDLWMLIRICDTKLSDIYWEEDGISIVNSEFDSLIMYYSCNVFILFKEGFLTMNWLNKAVWPGFSLKGASYTFMFSQVDELGILGEGCSGDSQKLH